MKSQALNNLDDRFEQTWAQLANEARKNKIGTEATEKSLSKLLTCLKWSTAYSVLQNQCLKVIQPFHEQANVIIKWFWVEYNETHHSSDFPPTPQEFFEWYCNSITIEQEKKMYSLNSLQPVAMA